MMSEQKVPRSVEQRIVIKFLVGENVPSAEIHHRLQQQYGEECLLLMLFIRGNAISGAPNINGTNQFPNPPIIIGITMKKIMTKAWAVTITL